MKKSLIVITGGGKGLGKSLATKFKSLGQVLVLTRSRVEEIKDVIYEYGDISDEKFITEVYNKYQKSYKIKYLINNAGCGLFGSPETNTKERIQKVINSNLIGMILNTTYAIPLLDSEGAKIINILSTAALKGNPNESLYCASKWGANGYCESLKAHYKGTKTKVITVYPGGMNTEFWNNNRDYVSVEKSSSWMDTNDIAEAIFRNVIDNSININSIVIERN